MCTLKLDESERMSIVKSNCRTILTHPVFNAKNVHRKDFNGIECSYNSIYMGPSCQVQLAGKYLCNNPLRPGFQFERTAHDVRTELNDAVLFMNNINGHQKLLKSNCVKMVVKLLERLKEFVTAINVEPAWLFYFVGIGMFYMPSQVPLLPN